MKSPHWWGKTNEVSIRSTIFPFERALPIDWKVKKKNAWTNAACDKKTLTRNMWASILTCVLFELFGCCWVDYDCWHPQLMFHLSWSFDPICDCNVLTRLQILGIFDSTYPLALFPTDACMVFYLQFCPSKLSPKTSCGVALQIF